MFVIHFITTWAHLWAVRKLHVLLVVKAVFSSQLYWSIIHITFCEFKMYCVTFLNFFFSFLLTVGWRFHKHLSFSLCTLILTLYGRWKWSEASRPRKSQHQVWVAGRSSLAGLPGPPSLLFRVFQVQGVADSVGLWGRHLLISRKRGIFEVELGSVSLLQRQSVTLGLVVRRSGFFSCVHFPTWALTWGKVSNQFLLTSEWRNDGCWPTEYLVGGRGVSTFSNPEQ